MIEKHLISRLGAKRVAALTPDDLDFMIAEMNKAGLSVTTTRYVLRIIHHVLRDAVRKGRLSRNVADLVDPPPERIHVGKTWDENEFDLFLTTAADSDYYEFYSTLVLIGTRRSEHWDSNGVMSSWTVSHQSYRFAELYINSVRTNG